MSARRRPALLGGTPAFEPGVPLVRPALPPLEVVCRRLAPSWDRGELTNGRLVRELEERLADRLGVGDVVAVSSCTSGLMLAVQALAPVGPVLVPSFTFSASAHALAWNGVAPLFVDCDPDSFQIDVDHAAAEVFMAGGIMGVHVFGAPCPVEPLEALARHAGIPLLFDSAHALGATTGGRAVGGFGDVEVFSLSPTKPLVAGEGGIVATNRRDIAETIRMTRDYGHAGDYDTIVAGMNARMSELHAAVALSCLDDLDDVLATRRQLAACYVAGLSEVPGLRAQAIADGDVSTYKDLTIAVDADVYGLPRDLLVRALEAEGVSCRRYFWPPVHFQQAYAHVRAPRLAVTERVAAEVVSLPLFPDLGEDVIARIVGLLADLSAAAPTLLAADAGAAAAQAGIARRGREAS